MKRAKVEQGGPAQESPGSPGSGRSSRLPRDTDFTEGIAFFQEMVKQADGGRA